MIQTAIRMIVDTAQKYSGLSTVSSIWPQSFQLEARQNATACKSIHRLRSHISIAADVTATDMSVVADENDLQMGLRLEYDRLTDMKVT